jgi:hypothetical protein
MSHSKRYHVMREHQQEYQADEEPRFVETSPGRYLTITGRSEPGGDDFQARTRALYKVAEVVEQGQRSGGKDFAIPSLEALWWQDGKGDWNWKLMLRVPDSVTDQDLAVARKSDGARHSLLDEVWLEHIDEGRVVQAMHLGPLEGEQATVDRMQRYAHERGFLFDGFHHEVYLTHPSEGPPDQQRTILRQRVVPATAAPRVP